MALRWLLALLLIGAASASQAATGDEDWCRNGLFPSEPPFALAQVIGAGRAWFHEDMEGCPDRGIACRQRAYVVAGDRVVTNRSHAAFTCAFFPSRGGGTAGWVAGERLRMLAVPANPPAAAWLGRWSSAGNPEIRITAQANGMTVSGQSFWPGRGSAAEYPSQHIGEIDGPLVRQGNRARYGDEDDCEVEFTLLGDLMVAGDNSHCGGANVTFSAVYRRMKR